MKKTYKATITFTTDPANRPERWAWTDLLDEEILGAEVHEVEETPGEVLVRFVVTGANQRHREMILEKWLPNPMNTRDAQLPHHHVENWEIL